MYLENYTGIFRIERRIRGFKDIRFPGNGVSFTTLAWGGAGAALGALPGIVAFQVFTALTPVLVAAVIALTVPAVCAYLLPRIVNRKGGDGRTAVQRITAWGLYRLTPGMHADGVPVRASTRRIQSDVIIAHR
jgi:hypothetical protein